MSGVKDSIKYFDLIHSEIISKMTNKKYFYHDNGEFLLQIMNGEIGVAMQNYWRELLMRTHFASITSIMRNERWLKGLNLSMITNNYILFTSSLRGFLESVTDSYYSLLSKPTDIASNFKNIKLAINGKLSRPLLSKEFEESLIHFQHASKSDKSGIKNNKPLSANNYIAIYDEYGDEDTKKLYSALCEVVHPANNSISCFTKLITETKDFEYARICVGLDGELIDKLIDNNSATISNLLKISISAPVLCLKVLNLLKSEFVESYYLESCLINSQIESSDGWHKILKMVQESNKLDH